MASLRRRLVEVLLLCVISLMLWGAFQYSWTCEKCEQSTAPGQRELGPKFGLDSPFET